MTFSNTIRENMYTLANLASSELNGYNAQAAHNKEQYLKMGRSVLRAIAKHLNLTEYKVNVNKAGIAVSGDITLIGLSENGKGIYISMSSPMLFGRPPHFYYRLVTHMKDYSGSGPNRNMTYQDLASDPEHACEIFEREYNPRRMVI